MPRLRRYWRLLRVAGVVLSGLIVAGALGIAERCAIPVSALRKQRLTQWFLTRLAAALPFRLRVKGELPTQPMLWVANHVSWCDIPLLGMLAPLSFLAKAEVRAWPALGWLAQAAGIAVHPPRRRRRGAGQSATGHAAGTGAPSTDLPRRHLDRWNRRANLPPQAVCLRARGRPCRPAGRHSLLAQRQAGHRRPFVGDDELPAHLRRLLTSDICDVEIQLLPPIDVMALDRKAVAMNAQQAIANALLVEPRAQISKAA